MKLLFASWLLGLPLLVGAQAQTPVGDGLRGDYYQGRQFKHFVRARRDATLDFNWREDRPVAGVSADEFAVRWSGWLLPPVTGHYVLHLAVDQGLRLWLDGRQLLDEWPGQKGGYFSVPVELQAGRPYRLRLDYSQQSRQSRVLFLWERPRRAESLNSWRNLWGGLSQAQAANHYQETVPTRYLFTHFPVPPLHAALSSVVVVGHTLPPPAVPPVVPHAAAPVPHAPKRPTRLPPLPLRRPTAPHPAVGVTSRAPAEPLLASRAVARADTLAARLAHGQRLTLRTLYFEQGQAALLAPVRASLDTLAQALRRYPALRLQVQGHTDNQGDPELNRQLSQRRAEAVCRYLQARGVAPHRLQPLGLGGTQPVADNALPAQRPHNRRVVLQPLP